MRVAIIEIIGMLIAELSNTMEAGAESAADENATAKQIAGLWDLLLERLLDVSTYVRAKALQVAVRLLGLPAKFPKQRLQLTKAAIEALEDKAATVRRAAIHGLVRLIETHPWDRFNGGPLNVEWWETEYQKIVDEMKTKENIADVMQRDDGDLDGDGEQEEGEESTGNRKKKYVWPVQEIGIC
jgi:condensin complex subunit 1